MKTRTKGLTDYSGGRLSLQGFGHLLAVRLSRAQQQSVRRYRGPLLTFVFGLVLAGCAMPAATPTEGDRSEIVGAIQTRIAETRTEEGPAEEDVMATNPSASSGTEDQIAATEEPEPLPAIVATTEQLELLAKLRPQGEAPELLNEVWLNSEPLKLADLRGNVVLVEFWTYG